MAKRKSNLPSKVSATGYTEAGKPEVWLQSDRLYIPRAVQAVVEPEDWPGGMRLEVGFEVSDDGKPLCREVRIQAPEGSVVTGQVLKEVTLPRIMAAAMVDAAWQHDPDTGQIGAAQRSEMEDRYPESMKRSTRGRRRSDDFLERIVKLYRHALETGQPPSCFIEREEKVDRSTVRRWLKDAEGRGLLPEGRLSAADGGRLRTASALRD